MTADKKDIGLASWIEYSGPDPKEARRFYREVLEWTLADLPMQDGSSYPGILVNDTPIGGFSPNIEEKGAWTIYVTVADVDAVVERAKFSGADILSEPKDAPGVGRMATIVDPQGARIAVISYAENG